MDLYPLSFDFCWVRTLGPSQKWRIFFWTKMVGHHFGQIWWATNHTFHHISPMVATVPRPNFHGTILGYYPLVICYIAIENGHRNSGFSHEQHGGSFHSKMLVHQRVSESAKLSFQKGRVFSLPEMWLRKLCQDLRCCLPFAINDYRWR